MKNTVSCLLMAILVFSINDGMARQSMKKFKNPANQFVGTWCVYDHDWREFLTVPIDLEKQMLKEAGSFPVGQAIRIERTGLSYMPGNYNSEKMNFDGPIGEALEVTVLTPFEKDLCKTYWSDLCAQHPKNYMMNFMIVEIVKWDAEDRARRSMWPSVKPIEYHLVDFSKSHNIDAWFDRQGDMILTIYMDGQSKDGKGNGIMGVRLKRMKELPTTP
ncbi:hypothetical protein [Massilia pseudoviolaceinigra]|uniref:hypothetical protein n=1 Tax=Massilia pseudoviolaceinigra TaxID=3057165 RepID=UPI0027966DA5|nr:hypothetical protein [Massilia sp. CCM 9206]MDQ1924212.1 hypothetical protein [Massilia sp. CCM 9206]